MAFNKVYQMFEMVAILVLMDTYVELGELDLKSSDVAILVLMDTYPERTLSHNRQKKSQSLF